MNKSILISAGIDYDEGVARFAGHADIYEKYLSRFLNEPEFENLRTYMNNKDYEKAFRSAHTLKGMVGNLSINRFFFKLRAFVEQLRNQTDISGAIQAFPDLDEEYCTAVAAIKEYFA